MSNLIPDAPPVQLSGVGPIITEAPPDASSYEQVCLRPLPPNTTLDYRVRVDDSTMDFYFHYDALPGASASYRKWVCRTIITADNPNEQIDQPGQQLYDVQVINPDEYDAKASAICTQDNPGFFSKLACGTASFGDLPQAAKWAIWAIAAIVALVSLVWIMSITSRVT
jgi:hypothetical protein